MAANYQASNIGSTTVGFYIDGGSYGITANGTWGSGSATLQKLSIDGSTYVPTAVAISTNSYQTVQLPAGTYRIALAGSGASGLYVDIGRVGI